MLLYGCIRVHLVYGNSFSRNKSVGLEHSLRGHNYISVGFNDKDLHC